MNLSRFPLRILLMLALPVLILLALEWAFRAQLWSPYAKPDSHAGTSQRKLEGLRDPRVQQIDFVTLGDSRAVYGIDHAALFAAAQARGQTHLNLSMPGSHWMTLILQQQWLKREHPELRGVVVGLSVSSFGGVFNGDYELGIVTPWRTWQDTNRVAELIPLQRGKPETYAVASALMAWRDDVSDLLQHPGPRRKALAWWSQQDHWLALQSNVDEQRDLCAVPLHRVSDCDALSNRACSRPVPACRACRLSSAGAMRRRWPDSRPKQKPRCATRFKITCAVGEPSDRQWSSCCRCMARGCRTSWRRIGTPGPCRSCVHCMRRARLSCLTTRGTSSTKARPTAMRSGTSTTTTTRVVSVLPSD